METETMATSNAGLLAGRSSSLTDASVTELSALLAAGSVSAVEVFQAHAARIEKINPILNAVIRFDPELGLAQARTADARRARGDRHPLLGIPYTLKDNIWFEGQVCSQGSALFEHFLAPSDAYASQRLRQAGAVFIGFTNCSEFACKGITSNPLFGATRNPWNPALTPGGSSGGAASAVAAGLCPLALATDAGGSTRRPAAHTGVVGMKPTAGLIPHPVGFAEPAFGNSVIGQMVRRVADLYPVLSELSVPCGADPLSLPQLPALRFDAPGLPTPRLRIGYSADLGLGFAVDASVARSVEAALERLQARGHEVVAVDPVWPQGASEDALMPLQWAGLAALHGEAWRRREWDVDPAIAEQIEKGLALGGADVARALYLRDELYRAMAAFFSQVDLMLTPTTPVTAWPLHDMGPATIAGRAASPRAHAVFTPIFNHTGMPAISVPCGLDDADLPIGLQIVGPRFSDATLLGLAQEVEADEGAWLPAKRVRA